uniref:Pentatricopeptide repeat-containing protein At4g19890 n=1 Tax=Anthurium amnicola TaxID=1678845 RepID=A0A1D1XHB8_9ARAE
MLVLFRLISSSGAGLLRFLSLRCRPWHAQLTDKRARPFSTASPSSPDADHLAAGLLVDSHGGSVGGSGSTSYPAEGSSNAVGRIYTLVCQSHEVGDVRLRTAPLDGRDLKPEQAATVFAMLADREGSMVAMSFFYWAIAQVEFRHFLRLYITATCALLRRGNLDKAQEVMRSLVTSFAEVGRLKEAVDMVFEMRNQGLPLSVHTLNWILRVAVETAAIDLVEKLFEEMPMYGVPPDACSFRTMISACCRAGRLANLERLLREMLESGFPVDNVTCTVVIDSFYEMGYSGRVILEKMPDMGLTPNVINYSALINGLCKRGSVKQAFQMLEEMVRRGLKPNVFIHTTLIDGLCKIGWTEKAFRLFLKLVRSDNYKPNVCTYTAMIGGYCKEDKMGRAEMLLARMREQGLEPNTNTYTTLINGYCKSGDLVRAYELMNQMTREGWLPNVCTYNTVLNGLLIKGRVDDAHRLLRTCIRCGPQPDQITYTILINEFCKQGDTTRALDFFYLMDKVGCKPDIHTYTTLISLFCKQRRMEYSKCLFNETLKLGLVPTKQTFTSMISGYCRDGNVGLAMEVFEKMAKHKCVADSVTYGALVSGLCKESKLQEARALYDAMVDKGLCPCEVTRVTLAYEYCKKDETSNAMAILGRLDKKLWIRTTSILVRKLSSEGKLEQAALFFHKLLDKDHNADYITYAAFVNACYDNNKYSVASDLTERISSGIRNSGPKIIEDVS